MKNKNGNALIMVVVLMVIIGLLLPHLIKWNTNESNWTVKEQKNTAAFHLAELALEQGYQQLILTTTTWPTVSSGTAIAGYNFDQTYNVDSGGEYQVRLSSATGGVYVTGVGRDKGKKETRGVKARYAGSGNLTYSIYSDGQVNIGGSADVEWGPVMARNDIDTGGTSHPRYYSTGKITPFDSSSTPPNSDNIQWWSYYASIPQMPAIDLNYYKGLAQAAGAAPAGCGGSYYAAGNVTFQGCSGGGGSAVTGTWYISGNVTFKAGGGGNVIDGTVIALGNLDMNGNGGATRPAMTVPLPPQAWKEYGNDWSYYKTTWDPAAPASYAAAKAADYLASASVSINNILVNGLLYQGGNYQATGSGNAAFYGVVVTQAGPNMGSNMTLYFNPNVASNARTTNNQIQRVEWKDVQCQWGAAGNATCP